MALDQAANFVREDITSAISAGDTTIDVTDASPFPVPPEGYNIVVWDMGNYAQPADDPDVEIMRVTGTDTTNDTLTVARGQEGTSDVSHPDTSEAYVAQTAKMIADIASEKISNPVTETVNADGNDVTNVGALDAGSINNDIRLESGGDAATVLDNAVTGDRIYVEPNTSFNLSFKPTIADGVGIFAGGNWVTSPTTIFVKQFDGTMAEIGSGVHMSGVYWDANKASHTGDGLDIGSSNSCRWMGVRVSHAAGDNLAADQPYFNVFDGCRFDLADGWGVNIQQTGAHASQNAWIGKTAISKNGVGGIRYGGGFGPVHSEFFDAVIASNQGPGIYYRASTVRNMHGVVNIASNDGPAMTVDSSPDNSRGTHFGGDLHLHASENVTAPSNDTITRNSGTRDLGTIHLQGDAGAAQNAVLEGFSFGGYFNNGGEPYLVACYDNTDVQIVFGEGGNLGSYSALVHSPDRDSTVNVLTPSLISSKSSGSTSGTTVNTL